MNDIIKIIKSLEDLGVLETWNKKQEGRFFGALEAPLAASLVEFLQ